MNLAITLDFDQRSALECGGNATAHVMTGWHHAPAHHLERAGAYIVTAATYAKKHLLTTSDRLTAFQEMLFAYAQEYRWQLQAWSIFSNHYHIIANSPSDATSLTTMLNQLHSDSASVLNLSDEIGGRQAWFNFWETHLTFERSYLARLKYVHTNPVKHGLVKEATQYAWCSANWFAQNAPRSLLKTVYSFKTDRLNVIDDF